MHASPPVGLVGDAGQSGDFIPVDDGVNRRWTGVPDCWRCRYSHQETTTSIGRLDEKLDVVFEFQKFGTDFAEPSFENPGANRSLIGDGKPGGVDRGGLVGNGSVRGVADDGRWNTGGRMPR